MYNTLNLTDKWQLVVLDECGKKLSLVPDPTFLPVTGNSVTTKEGYFLINEISIDYDNRTVICYSTDYEIIN